MSAKIHSDPDLRPSYQFWLLCFCVVSLCRTIVDTNHTICVEQSYRKIVVGIESGNFQQNASKRLNYVSIRAVNGVFSELLITTVHPADRAGATFQANISDIT